MAKLRDIWASQGHTIGGFCVVPSAAAAELMGSVGFDWVCVDTQHGLIGGDVMPIMVNALAATGTPPLVRVAWNDPKYIRDAIGAGAEGVLIPMVNSADEAVMAVSTSRSTPASIDPVVAIMIETPDGVRNADQILGVPGIDAVYIGPNDLAVGHGIPPTADPVEPEHVRLIDEILKAALRHGVTPGIHCGSTDTALRWRQHGFRMLNVSSDAVFMRQSASALVKALRGTPAEAPKSSSYT